MAEPFVPDRGDIVWLQFSPQAGHEQSGHRPALVLSPRAYNKRTGLALCSPITNQRKGYPFEVALPSELAADGVVLADQIRCLDWRARHAKPICRAPEEVSSEVLRKVKLLLETL